jgi:hypothetical protein
VWLLWWLLSLLRSGNGRAKTEECERCFFLGIVAHSEQKGGGLVG